MQHPQLEANNNVMEALCALDPETHDFDVKPLLDLSKADLVEAEFSVACQFLPLWLQ
jgi:hypothetical protein